MKQHRLTAGRLIRSPGCDQTAYSSCNECQEERTAVGKEGRRCWRAAEHKSSWERTRTDHTSSTNSRGGESWHKAAAGVEVM
ncbi:hypothetical protein MHYP_G00243720 [Metynnis hypsauchen]